MWTGVLTSRHFRPGLRFNCYMASLGKLKRRLYRRLYPTMIVYPDGSTISIRFKEPRQIIKLPIDLSKLSEQERRERMSSIYRSKRKVEDADPQLSYSHKGYSFLYNKKADS